MNSIFNFKNGISFVAIALMLLAGCTFYDNYDITLMPATASIESSSSEASSSSKEKDTLYVINVGGSSDSKSSSSKGVPTWTCGDSVMVRGGVEYETVEIAGVCITKKNLNYKPMDGKTLCYDNLEENCEKYGLLYDYEAAEQACPTGWRLLTEDDLNRFIASANATVDEGGAHFKVPGAWHPDTSRFGTVHSDAPDGDDLIEFSALPGGTCDIDEDEDSGYSCEREGSVSQWWTSTDKSKVDQTKCTLYLHHENDGVRIASLEQYEFAYVRCAWKKI
ncbi:FISUMP domain-containing protein [uncultured Fibrobacter sp.]|uniref:FISUMP domain-containing protein n=1 Tax=uncultured Fibrobacter sp. TaxID=261512 RepID=UPI001567732E|nr:FISUMP domain-containing protein [uncultured Fibrobacter sp.]